MSKLKSLSLKAVGFLARCAMRTGAIILSTDAKRELLSAAIGWFVQRNGYQPLTLTHASSFGDFELSSDGWQIQLVWQVKDRPPSNDREPNRPDDVPDTQATRDCKCATQTSNPSPATATPISSAVASAVSAEYVATDSLIGDMLGDMGSDKIGDSVESLVGDLFDDAISDMMDSVFDRDDDQPSVKRQQNFKGSSHHHERPAPLREGTVTMQP